jgi:hypothetical protein
MLTDDQIDRYSRQIVVPEIGGRGQERLLRAEVAIEGGGDAALVCASYLAGAGLGSLSLGGVDPRCELGDVLGLETRNPDCRVLRAPVQPSVMIVIGQVPPRFPREVAVLWGTTNGDWLRRAYLPPGRGCAPCLSNLAGRRPPEESFPQILGAVLALDALRTLLELSPNEPPTLVEIDLARLAYRSLPFPARAECSLCH